MSGFLYLGSPYSLYPNGHDEAARVVAETAAVLMAGGMAVYCPIAHGHAIAKHGALPHEWEFWKKQCQPMIDAARALLVLRMRGWQESVGLTYEIGQFAAAGKPILFLDPVVGAEKP